MTENDPSAQDNAGAPDNRGAETYGAAAQGRFPYGRPDQGEASTPPKGTPIPGGQQGGDAVPNPWSAQAQSPGSAQPGLGYSQVSHAEAGAYGGQAGQQYPYRQQGPGMPQSTAAFPNASTPQQRTRGTSWGKLVAGVGLVALLVGGVAGGVGGYLASDSTNGDSSASALEAPKPAKQTGNAPEGTVESAASKVTPSVVQLKISGARGTGEGSGFVLSQDGYILTNNHVVESAAQGGQIQAVFQDGNKASAKVVGRDPTTDVAVIKAENVGGLRPVELGRSDDLKVGQGVVAIGSPYELSGTVTSGIISAMHRPVRAGGSSGDQQTVMDAVQTDAAINPGNSGGPLVDMSGQVIGINSAIYSPPSGSGGMPRQQSESGSVGIGFAIPIDQARRTADEIIKNGQATQTYIGATVGDAPQGGAAIAEVVPGSPAEQAGLKAGDVVTKLDDRSLDSADALVAGIRTRAPGESVTLTVGDSRPVQITLAGKPVPTN